MMCACMFLREKACAQKLYISYCFFNYYFLYLDVKLQVASVHLSGHHTFYHLHWHKLEAVEGWTDDIMGFTLLDL